MRFLIFNLLITNFCFAQVKYTEPPTDHLPDKIKSLPVEIRVNHFPEIVNPTLEDDTYFWKHNTGFLSENSDIIIVEYGAFLYYNDDWHLRRAYPLEDLTHLFGISDLKMKQGEPYTFVRNWREDKNLYGGWALWYVIGKRPDGKQVCGFARVYTSDNLLN